MNDDPADLCRKITRLVQERGWNMEEFARRSGLNRLTVRHLLLGQSRRLHNATVAACARSLDLTVGDLRDRPVEQLLRGRPFPADSASIAYDRATQPELAAWLQAHPREAALLGAEDLDELLSLQGTGGPLTSAGVAEHVAHLERRRRLVARVVAICGTEYLEFLEQMVELLFEKIQPYGTDA